jgi:hypothetical protein
MSDIKTRAISAFEEPTLAGAQREALVKKLHENSALCTAKSGQSYVSFIAMCAAFSLVAMADLPKVAILGVDVAKTSPVLLLLPPLAAFFVYRASCMNQLAVMTQKALKAHYELAAPGFVANRLLPLLQDPGSVLELEDTFNDLSDSGSGTWTVIAAALVIVAGPLAWLSLILWWVFAQTAFALALKVGTAALVVLFVGKAIWVIRQTWPLV